jgi:ATP-dependent Clp protease adaptor protein ClpS
MPRTLETPTIDLEDVTRFLDEDGWAVIVWNDDVNTFDHVIKALVEILHHDLERARNLTWKVHNEGKAVVGVRPKEEAEAAVAAFHRRKIQASLDRA